MRSLLLITALVLIVSLVLIWFVPLIGAIFACSAMVGIMYIAGYHFFGRFGGTLDGERKSMWGFWD